MTMSTSSRQSLTSRQTAGKATMSKLDELTAELAVWKAKKKEAEEGIKRVNEAILPLVQKFDMPETKDGAEKSTFATFSAGELRVTRPDPRTPEVDATRLLQNIIEHCGGDLDRARRTFLNVTVIKKIDIDVRAWEDAIDAEEVTDDLLARALIEFEAPKPSIAFTEKKR